VERSGTPRDTAGIPNKPFIGDKNPRLPQFQMLNFSNYVSLPGLIYYVTKHISMFNDVSRGVQNALTSHRSISILYIVLDFTQHDDPTYLTHVAIISMP
jgi:hypothetical protein